MSAGILAGLLLASLFLIASDWKSDTTLAVALRHFNTTVFAASCCGLIGAMLP